MKTQMTEREVQFLQDIRAFLLAAISGEMEFSEVLCCLGHDINGVINRNCSLDPPDCFVPRVNGYRNKTQSIE